MPHLPSIGTEWLQALLVGDATLLASLPGGVHRDLAEADTPLPYLVWSEEDGSPFNAAGARAYVAVPLTLQVVADDNADPARQEAALSRLEDLLMPGGRTLRVEYRGVSIRVIPGASYAPAPEPIEGGVVLRHKGATWLLYLS